MSRAVGVTAVLSDLPDAVVVLFAILTQLGDFWFTVSVCTLAYWLGPRTPRLGAGLTRERGAMLVAVLVGAVTLTVTLKTAFALPRPAGAGLAPEATLVPAAVRDIYVSMATGDGYGFPSGHATVGVAVWGALAWAVRVGTRRQRAAVAGTAIALILASRLVLGVHYAVDVVAGGLVAATFLWLALTRLETPPRVFALGAVVALAGLAAAGPTPDIGAVVGMTVAGALVSARLPSLPSPTPRSASYTVAFGAIALGAVGALAVRVGTTGPRTVVIAAVGVALLLVAPLVGERVAKKGGRGSRS